MSTRPEKEKTDAEMKPKRSKKLIAGICVLTVLLIGEVGFFAYLLIDHGKELISLITEPTAEPTPTPDTYPDNTKLETTMNEILDDEDGSASEMLDYCMGEAKEMKDAGQKADMYKRCAQLTDKYLKENVEIFKKDENAKKRTYLEKMLLACIHYAEAAQPSSTIERLIAQYEEEYGNENAKRDIIYYSALADARDNSEENPEQIANEAVRKAFNINSEGRGGGTQ